MSRGTAATAPLTYIISDFSQRGVNATVSSLDASTTTRQEEEEESSPRMYDCAVQTTAPERQQKAVECLDDTRDLVSITKCVFDDGWFFLDGEGAVTSINLIYLYALFKLFWWVASLLVFILSLVCTIYRTPFVRKCYCYRHNNGLNFHFI